MSTVILTKRDFSAIQEIAYHSLHVSSVEQFSGLHTLVMQFVRAEYSACGHFSLVQHEEPGLAVSNYSQEFCQLYMTQGLVADPSVVRLLSTSVGQTSSLDDPRIVEPRTVLSLKLDYGIQTCHSVSIRGADNWSMYMAFSNFDLRQQARLKVLLDILGPHLYLAFQRAYARQKVHHRQGISLTPREDEILRWVAEGKSNWEISVICKVSLNTIKFHLSNIMGKLGVEHRWAAIAAWHELTQQYRLPTSGTREVSLMAPPLSSPRRLS